MTLPSGRYMHDDVQYFPSGPDFPWANTQAATQRARMRAMGIEPPPPVGTAGVAPGNLSPYQQPIGQGGIQQNVNVQPRVEPPLPFRHSRYLPVPSLCPAACPLRLRQVLNLAPSNPDRLAVTSPFGTLQHDEMARPTRHVEGIRPDQNPADYRPDGVTPGVLYLVVLLHLTWLVVTQSLPSRQDSSREEGRVLNGRTPTNVSRR